MRESGSPRDSGGRTNQSVIQRVYDRCRASEGRPRRDVYLMEPAVRDAIHRAQYWDVVASISIGTGTNVTMADNVNDT